MRINTFASFGLLSVVACVSATDYEENELVVSEGERDLAMNKMKEHKMRMRQKKKAERAAKRAERKKKKKNMTKEKPVYHIPVTVPEPDYYDNKDNNDWHNLSMPDRCILTACIETYERERSNIDWKKKSTKSPGSWKNTDRELFIGSYVRGKVTLNFDHYDPYYTPVGYFPMTPASKYYYASDFLFSYDLGGLSPFTKGDVVVTDADYCEMINPDYVPIFYDYYKLRNSPYDASVGYDTGADYIASEEAWINDGFDCYAHVGKAVFVELPEARGTYYGCGILYKGDHKCKD